LNDKSPDEIPRGKRPWIGVLVLIAVLVALTAVTPLLLRSCVLEPVRKTADSARDATIAVREAARAIREVLQVEPEVRMETKVIQKQVSPIAELAVAEREMEIRFSWSEQWLKSTKSIELASPFRVKAGFDLEKPVRVLFDPQQEALRIELPKAEILTVERFGTLEYTDDSGWWNKVKDEDREAALNALNDEAIRHAQKSDLVQKAEQIISDRLNTMLSSNAMTLEIVFLDEENNSSIDQYRIEPN
jgi:hypothetical protein